MTLIAASVIAMLAAWMVGGVAEAVGGSVFSFAVQFVVSVFVFVYARNWLNRLRGG